MKFKKNLFKILRHSLFLISFVNAFNISLIKGSEEALTPHNTNSDFQNTFSKNEFYILDSGDELFIEFSGLDIFTNNYLIDRDGYITLPEIQSVFVRGLTLSELKQILIKEYEKTIIKPEIFITQIRFRPVKIFISGEVNRPGLYTLEQPDEKSVSQVSRQFNIPSAVISGLSFNQSKSDNPRIEGIVTQKLFDALKLGKGITNYADLSKVIIIRNTPRSMGNGKIKTTVNVLEMIIKGDQSGNIEIFDGDSIIVPKSQKIIKDQLLQVNRSNLTPDSLDVFINGNVRIPGRITLKQNSSLIEAILAVGGQNSFIGNIEFIRFDNFGKRNKTVIRYDLDAIKGSRNNPILLDGDIIIVRKNLVGKTTSAIKEFGSPIISSYGLYKIFE